VQLEEVHNIILDEEEVHTMILVRLVI